MGTRCLYRLTLALTAAAFPMAWQAVSANTRGCLSVPTRRCQLRANHLADLRAIAEVIAKRYQVSVIVDPEITLSFPPKAPPTTTNVEGALGSLAASLPGVAWRRLYLERSSDSRLPLPQSLAAAARALEGITLGSLAYENPTKRRATVFLKIRPSALAMVPAQEPGQKRREPIYLFYSTAASGTDRDPVEHLAELQRQQLEIDAGSDRRSQAYVQMVQLLQTMPPAGRELFLSRTLEAGTKLWDDTPPEERETMVRQTLELLQQAGAGPMSPPTGVQPRRERERPAAKIASEQLRRELTSIVRGLEKRYETRILVDPAIPLTASPQAPAAGNSLAEELDRFVASVHGVAWRRVYLPRSSRNRVPSPERLSSAVRALEQLDTGGLILEDTTTRQATVLRRDEPVSSSFVAEVEARYLDRTPVYLLFSLDGNGAAGTPLERFVDLQSQQIRLLPAMTADELAQSMEQVVRIYRSADADRRERIIGLPVMAALMAVWCPQAAKEKALP